MKYRLLLMITLPYSLFLVSSENKQIPLQVPLQVVTKLTTETPLLPRQHTGKLSWTERCFKVCCCANDDLIPICATDKCTVCLCASICVVSVTSLILLAAQHT